MFAQSKFEKVKRSVEYLEDISAREGLELEVRFVGKKIIPQIQPKSVPRKKRVLEFPNAILDELNEDEIKAIGLHEIGHFAHGRFLLRFANLLVVAIFTGLIIDFLLLKLCDMTSLVRIFPATLGAAYVACRSVRWSEHSADKYAAKIIGSDTVINALLKLSAWARKQPEFRKRWKKILVKLFPMHPSDKSRIRFLEKDYR